MRKVGQAVLTSAVPGDPAVQVSLNSMQMAARRSSATESSTFGSALSTSDGGTSVTLGAGVKDVLSGLDTSQGVDIQVATFRFATHDPKAIEIDINFTSNSTEAGGVSPTMGSGVTAVDLRLPGGAEVNITGLSSPLVFALPLDLLSVQSLNASSASFVWAPSCQYWDDDGAMYRRAGCTAAPNPRPRGASPGFAAGLAGSSAPQWTLSGLHTPCQITATWNANKDVHTYALSGEGCMHIRTSDGDGDANASEDEEYCLWNDATQRFEGSSCELSLYLECGCNHATDYVAVLDPPKFAEASESQLLPSFEDVMEIWRLLASFVAIFLVALGVAIAFHLRDRSLNEADLKELFHASNGFVRGPSGEWTWYFYELSDVVVKLSSTEEKGEKEGIHDQCRPEDHEDIVVSVDAPSLKAEKFRIEEGLTGIKDKMGPAVLLCSAMGIPYNRLRMAVPPEVLKLRVPLRVHQGILPAVVFDDNDNGDLALDSHTDSEKSAHGNTRGWSAKDGKLRGEAHAARLVGTSMAFAFIRVQRLVPAAEFRREMLRAAHLVDGGTAEAGRAFHELFDVFRAMLSDGNINSPGWFTRFPIWQLLFMCQSDGSWQISESLAHAVWALDSNSPGYDLPTNAHLFDVEALVRAIPDVLHDMTPELVAKGYSVGEVWATLLAVAFLDFQHEAYYVRGAAMERAHALNTRGSAFGAGPDEKCRMGSSPMSELGNNFLHFAGDACPSLGELIPHLFLCAEGCVARWQRQHSARIKAFLESEEARISKGPVAFRNAKNLVHRALNLHQVLNVLVAPPHGDGFPRSMRILTISAAWGTALATAIWLAWNRMQLCCDSYHDELSCRKSVSAYDGSAETPFCVVDDVEYRTCGSLQIGNVALPDCNAFPDPRSLRDIAWVALLTFVIGWPIKKILTKLFFMANADDIGNNWVKKEPGERLRDTFQLTLLGKQLDAVEAQEREDLVRNEGMSKAETQGGNSDSKGGSDVSPTIVTTGEVPTSKDEEESELFVADQKEVAEGLERQEDFKRKQIQVQQVGLSFGDVILRSILVFIASLNFESIFPGVGMIWKVITCDDSDNDGSNGGNGNDNNDGGGMQDEESHPSFNTRVDMSAEPSGPATSVLAASSLVAREDGKKLAGVHGRIIGWKIASLYRAPMLLSLRGLLSKLEGSDRISHKSLTCEGGTNTRFPIELVSACTFMQLWWRMMRDGKSCLFYSLLESACVTLGLSQDDLTDKILDVIDVNADGFLDELEFSFLSTLGDLVLSVAEGNAFFAALCKIERELGPLGGKVDEEDGSGIIDGNLNEESRQCGVRALHALIFSPPRRSFCVSLEGETLMTLSRVYKASPSRLGQLNKNRLMSDIHRLSPHPMFALVRSKLPAGTVVLLPSPLLRGSGQDTIIMATGIKADGSFGLSPHEDNREFEILEANGKSLEEWLRNEEKRLKENSRFRKISFAFVIFFLMCLWSVLSWSVAVFGFQLYNLIGDEEEFALYVNFFASLVMEIFVLEWQRIVIAVLMGAAWATAVTYLGGPDADIRRLEQHYDELSRREQMEVARRLAAARSGDATADTIITRQFQRTMAHESGPGG